MPQRALLSSCLLMLAVVGCDSPPVTARDAGGGGTDASVDTGVARTDSGPRLSYCDRTPRAEWDVKPDSLCDATSCRKNTDGMTDVCDPDTTCNAWQLRGGFGAQGVEIEPDGMAPGPGMPAAGVECPAEAPNAAQLGGACCARASNAGRLTAPELRISSLQLTAPVGSLLTGSIVTGLLQRSFDLELFNWLIETTGAPMTGNGPLMIRTGYGQRNETTGRFSFTTGEPMGTGRWNPVTVNGTITGNTVAAQAASTVITVPIFDESTPPRLQLELPVYALSITRAELDPTRTCIGTRNLSAYTTTSADLVGYIRVDQANMLVNVPPVNTTLCSLINNSLTN